MRQEAAGVALEVLVQPRASRTRVVGVHDGRLKVQLAAPPVDGEANAALVAFLAGALGVRRADVTITRGETGRRKTVRVAGTTAAQVEGALAAGAP
ncbi:MAG: YggU family protein [Anaeromyxobacter sp.]|nr:YggU family protein [Anaeromyxobacter sp.]MBL0277280.1 YggU family protein [Anaeromyxobacter sp.]